MISSDFRTEARRKLSGKWGKLALTILAFTAVIFLAGFIEGFIQGLCGEDSIIASIFSLAFAIIELPLVFGLLISHFKAYKGENTKAFDFLSLGFSNFGKSWSITFRILLKLIVPIILCISSYVLVAYGLISSAITVAPLVAASVTESSINFAALTGANLAIVVVGLILMLVSDILMITKSYYYRLAFVVAADDTTLTAKEAVEKSKELMTGNRWKLFCLQFSFIGWSILASFTFGIGFLFLLPYVQFATFEFYAFLNGKKVVAEPTVENN